MQCFLLRNFATFKWPNFNAPKLSLLFYKKEKNAVSRKLPQVTTCHYPPPTQTVKERNFLIFYKEKKKERNFLGKQLQEQSLSVFIHPNQQRYFSFVF
jgi:hypothetical protein